MTTLFISDLHLGDNHPETLSLFEKFIKEQASQAQTLYILGDLFEVWVGDDDASKTAQTVAELLKSLSDQGTKVYYIHGNRDFLLGPAYAARCGMTVLPDPTEIEIDGKNILLTHGDLLCTDDVEYQKLRRLVRKPWVQKLFLLLPRKLRESIGETLRKESNKAHRYKAESDTDVSPLTVMSWFEQYPEVTVMIHGHTHKPYHHQVKYSHRYVLGAWDIKPVILVMAGGQIILKEWPAV